ncbi:MAG: methyl-accepting chemotaxis protein, partial [Spirochaetaceae bacterium]
MAKMKMRTKITSGFVLMIILLLLVSGVAVFFLNKASTDFIQYRQWAVDSNMLNELQENMLMVRMNVKDFLTRGEEKLVQEVNEYYEETKSFVEIAQADITDPERVPLVDKIDDELEEYKDYFEQVVELQGQRDERVVDGMDVVGPEIEEDLTAILTSAEEDGDMTAAYYSSLALRNLMLVRLYAFKFLDSHSEADEQRVLAELESFDKNMEILDREVQNPERKALLQEVHEGGDEYKKYVTETVSIIYERNDYVDNHMDVLGQDIVEVGQQIIASITGDQDRLGPALQAANQRAIMIAIAASIVALILGIFLTLYITGSILKQLGADPSVIQDIAERIAIGDLDIQIKDENIRGVYLSVKEMVDSLRYKASVVEQVANKDLSVEIDVASDRDVLGKSLLTMKESLNELLGQVNSSVEQVTSGADQVSQASQNLSQGATEQASSLEEITSSTNEINSQSKQNAENATEAHGIAKQATEDAEKGNIQMQQLSESMEKINASSDEINKVVKVIDDIAFQINLLALNANVEAARAGKYGKGFAVVADEVRNLAVKSTDSVKETTRMVEDTVTNIKEGTEAAEATNKQLTSIVEGSGKVANFLEEIAQASREQAQAIEQITEGLDQIDQATQASTASAEESASASEELAGQAQQLRSMVAQFKLDQRYSGGGRQLLAQQTQQAGRQTGNSSTSGSYGSGRRDGSSQEQKSETGITPVKAEEQISLDDD